MESQRRQAPEGQWIVSAVARFEGPLIVYARRIVGDLEHARDVVQETFLKLCETRREQVEPRLAEWLYTVCRNRAIDVRRKEWRARPMGPEAAMLCESRELSAEQLMEQEESAEWIARRIDALPENQRETIRLKFEHGLSYREISGITGLSVSNVGYLIHHGMATLRGEWKHESRLPLDGRGKA